jgi:3-oxoacyl-(acyl-carrier-protein) synthase
MSPEVGFPALVTGVISGSCELPWPAEGEIDPLERPEALRRAVEASATWTAAMARQAMANASLAPPAGAGASCFMGTLYGGGAVNEYVACALATLGPRSLNPETCGLAAPYGATGVVCADLGLSGPGVTLVGASAGMDAVGLALHSIATGGSQVAVCGAFDWLTPLALDLFGSAGLSVGSRCRVAAFVVLEEPRHARERGAGPRGEVLAWAGGTLPRGPRSDPTAAIARVITRAVVESGLAPRQLRWWLSSPTPPSRALAAAAARAVAGSLGVAVELVGGEQRCPSPAVAPLLDLQAQFLSSRQTEDAGVPPPASLLTSITPQGGCSALVCRPVAG